ncbi:MAG: hypothetical protein HZY76_13895 [Anaerolineae bacterium]|nr:MAG: hypothetical protein HZY76_13895 [Anaerolineae bacterium]
MAGIQNLLVRASGGIQVVAPEVIVAHGQVSKDVLGRRLVEVGDQRVRVAGARAS